MFTALVSGQDTTHHVGFDLIMNILFVNISDIKGGAALGSYRLHERIQEIPGFHSRLLVGEAISGSEKVNELPVTRVDKLLRPVSRFVGLNYIDSISSFNTITDHPFYKQADIVHLHCLHGGYFNYLALPKITKKKPTVYKLSDMWSFTGHCSYSFDCQRWKSGCGQCPYPETYPSIRRDSTNIEWRLKKWVYENSSLTIVSPSKWLKQTAAKGILNKFDIVHISNGIDTNVYKPIDKSISRKAIGLSDQGLVLLFASQSLANPRKGMDLLIDSLKSLPSRIKRNLTLVCFGNGGDWFRNQIDLPIVDLGYVSGDRLKALAYSASDVFVCPTRADAFGLVLLESLACGTPIVSFDNSAVPELVRHKITGLLAKPESSFDLARQIIRLLEDSQMRQSMAINCRKIAVKEYSIELQSKRYIDLFDDTIRRFNKSKLTISRV